MTSILVATSTTCGSSGSLTLQTDAAQSKCQSGISRTAVTEWNERYAPFAVPFINSQKGNFLRVADFSDTTIKSYANKFYGTFVLGLDTPIPEPVSVTVVLPRTKGARTYKEFKEKQKAGEILLTPIHRRKIDLSATPGLYLPGNPLTGPTVSHRLLWDTFEDRRTLCWAQSGLRKYDPVRGGIWPSALLSTSVNYSRFDDPEPIKVPLDRSELVDFAGELGAFVDNQDLDVNLITTARAVAASGILDLTTTLAEAPETLKMILEACRLLLAKYLEVRKKIDVLKRNKINHDDFVTQVTALWMQYRYAIMPNVYTIEDGLKYLDASLTKYITVREGASHECILPEVAGWVPSSASLNIINRCFIKNRFNVESLTKESAFLSKNMLVTAWELVPLSFVVDWVIQVGDWIASLTAPTGSVQEAGQFSWQVKPVDVVYTHPSYQGANLCVNYSSYRAEIINPKDHIGLRVNLSMNWKRVLDALSLTWLITRSNFKRQSLKGGF